MGLSQIKGLLWRIIEAHGGSIAASSKPGQGAVFTLSLPSSESRAVGSRCLVPCHFFPPDSSISQIDKTDSAKSDT